MQVLAVRPDKHERSPIRAHQELPHAGHDAELIYPRFLKFPKTFKKTSLPAMSHLPWQSEFGKCCTSLTGILKTMHGGRRKP